jgi:hypothetical protein
MASAGWLCRKVACGRRNPATTQKCECGSRRPKKRVPAHRKALRDFSYEQYVEVNREIHGVDEECAVCGRERDPDRRLDRDHDHRAANVSPAAGRPRGLVCVTDNILMPPKLTADKAEEIAAYLRRVEDFYAAEEAA